MEAERKSAWCVAGKSAPALSDGNLRKPFWYGKQCRHYLADFCKLERCLERVGLAPPATVLELGCGTGWMSEFLVLMGYRVVATTISEFEVADGQKRVASLKLKHQDIALEFLASPMETVHEAVAAKAPFDAVLVYEALHHAFDWRESIGSAFRCLRPGGWFLLCGEPNLLHVFKSYRIGRLTNTHEIGFSRRALLRQLRACGFKRRIVACSPFHFFNQPHWMLAQK
jgi:SAM-dependent methyltransferase